jgi:hypothetical protein
MLAPLNLINQNCPDLGLDAFAMRVVPLAEQSVPRLRTPVLMLAAYGHWHRGDVDEARRLAEQSLDGGIVASIVSPLDPYVGLVTFEMTAGNQARAFELIDVVRVHVANGHTLDEARNLGGFASFEAMAGRFDTARADSERALQLAQRTGNRHALLNALQGRAWALHRDDPAGALAVAEQFLEIYRASEAARGVAPGLMALAAGMRARLGDDRGALPLLREAVVIARDDGALPQAAAAIGFALNPWCRIGRWDVAAVLLGALEHGAFAQVAGFPGTADARARTHARIRDELGEETTDLLMARGAAMSQDEMIRFAIDQLEAQ